MSERAPSEAALETFARVLNAALNRALALDADAAQRLTRLEGRTLAIALRGRRWRLFAVVRGGRLEVGRVPAAADVTISGSPADFIALARANQRGEMLGAGRVEIQGDLAIAQEVQGLLSELDLDWEGWLAVHLGDITAHRIGRAVRGALAFGEKTARRFELDIAEYLRHELMILPQREEVERYGRAVFDLADAVDRAEARLRRLVSRRQGR